MRDWKQIHANESCKALEHPLVKDVIAEQMLNLGRTDGLTKYGLNKIAMYAAQVARAQALGFDPDSLRLAADEGREEMIKLAERMVLAGKPVIVAETGEVKP